MILPIPPSGRPALSTNKSAATRMENNLVRGARQQMPHNAMAQAAVHTAPPSNARSSGPPVGNPSTDFPINPPSPPQLPTGSPQMPAQPEFDAGAFQDPTAMLEQIVDNVRTQQFLNSPRVKDAIMSETLKSFFNATNLDATKDPRNFFKRVLGRLHLVD